MMHTTSKWITNFKSVVDNGRTHSVVLDLTENGGGDDTGPTALELCLMSLSGCITTIFALMADKMRLEYQELEASIDGHKTKDDATITRVDIKVTVTSDADQKRIEKCLDKTIENCPVGVLFKEAGVEMVPTLEVHKPDMVAY